MCQMLAARRAARRRRIGEGSAWIMTFRVRQLARRFFGAGRHASASNCSRPRPPPSARPLDFIGSGRRRRWSGARAHALHLGSEWPNKVAAPCCSGAQCFARWPRRPLTDCHVGGQIESTELAHPFVCSGSFKSSHLHFIRRAGEPTKWCLNGAKKLELAGAAHQFGRACTRVALWGGWRLFSLARA